MHRHRDINMTKSPKQKTVIEQNRSLITEMLSGAGTHKRLNNMNWIRHEMSYTEPRTLFFVPNKQQTPYLDYNYIKNLGNAYDYIVENTQTPINAIEIVKLHNMLCINTNIMGGKFRTTPKVLEITVNGQRYHAPDAQEIPSELNNIVFKMLNSKEHTLTRAFNIHYDLIMLQPFDDFNKRTARLVMNWILIQGGYRPIIFNNPTDKQKYKDAIAQCANGNIKAYTTYMYSCMARTQKSIIKLLSKSKIM